MVWIVQRIIVNKYGWTRPAPDRLGPIGEGTYVQENGFGLEDWNFNLQLAQHEYVYGYAYYNPSASKADGQFQIAFVTYVGQKWRLVGFYLDAEYCAEGGPKSRTLLNAKRRDLLALKSANSLGRPWARLNPAQLIDKLKDEAEFLHWKVHVKNVIALSQPVVIPKRLFPSTNYHMTRPTGVSAAMFKSLRSLGSRAALPEEDDEIGFPEGREYYLQHRARERNPNVVRAAKAKFLQDHGRYVCQCCRFNFEDVYGKIGRGFIEAHHITPVRDLQPGSMTKVADIALVCSNCHRMLHRRRPWITMSDLETLIGQQ